MKRFTETAKWDDAWFWELSTPAKLLYLFLLDHCDNAGVVDCNLKLASLKIGEAVDSETVSELGDRLQRLANGKLHLVKFVRFQYGTLKPSSNLHASVLNLLNQHELTVSPPVALVKPSCSPTEPITPTRDGSKYSKGTVQVKVQEGGTGGRFIKPTIEEVKLHAAKIGLPEHECKPFWNYYESNGWRVGKNPMKSWQAAMVNWRVHSETWRIGPPASNGATVVVKGKELERILARLTTLKGTYGDHQNWSEDDRAEFKKLRARRDELRRELGIVA